MGGGFFVPCQRFPSARQKGLADEQPAGAMVLLAGSPAGPVGPLAMPANQGDLLAIQRKLLAHAGKLPALRQIWRTERAGGGALGERALPRAPAGPAPTHFGNFHGLGRTFLAHLGVAVLPTGPAGDSQAAQAPVLKVKMDGSIPALAA